jgi:hypothetical protein
MKDCNQLQLETEAQRLVLLDLLCSKWTLEFSLGQIGGNIASNDVPNSYTSELKLGYAASKFYGDAYVANQTSTSGVDIWQKVFKAFSQLQK